MGKKPQSIVVSDMEHCWVCGSPYTEEHHIIYGGANRRLSEKYHLTIGLCGVHHRDWKEGVHFNQDMNLTLRRMAQEAFEEHYPELSFREIFGKTYKEEK